MNEKSVRLLNLLKDISIDIGITPPFSNDIGEWWEKGLEEISDYWLYEIEKSELFRNKKSLILQEMRQLLLKQIEKRQLLNTLA